MTITTLGTSHGDPTYKRFQSATVLRINEATAYLIDAGAPTSALLVRSGISHKILRAVFITHQHDDHMSGIIGVIKALNKYRKESNNPTPVYFPEQTGIDGTRSFLRAVHLEPPAEVVDYRVLPHGGLCYEDEHITVETLPTRHLGGVPDGFPSYSFMFTVSGKRIMFSGDIRGDFSDFPLGPDSEPVDFCVCECTHFPMEVALPVLRELPIKRILFNHVANRWHGAEAEARFVELISALPYPAEMAADGATYTVSG